MYSSEQNAMHLNEIDGDKPLAETPAPAGAAAAPRNPATPATTSPMTGDPGRYHIELVDKVVRLLEALRDQPNGLTLQELASRTGYVKSSVHRAMQSLKVRGYVEQPMVGGPYRLGVQCLLLARGLQEGIGLIGLARPYMRELVDTFDESGYLAIVRGGRGIFVEVTETRRRELRLVGPLGAVVHYHATAAGKVIAANLPSIARGALLARLPLDKLTGRTHIRRADVEQEWESVLRRGYATNDEETIVGAVFLAAPVFDAERAVCGGISLGIPKARYSVALGRRIATQLVESCARLSETLGNAGYVHEDRQLHDLR
jgi:DNA-binding IclR family transcriptional regulator